MAQVDDPFLRKLLNPEESDQQLLSLLLNKLSHLEERLTALPKNIIGHLQLYVKHRPHLLKDDSVISAAKGLLRATKAVGGGKKMPSTTSDLSNLSIILISMLYTAYQFEREWPIDLFELFLDDSLHHRLWVDGSETLLFRKNLLLWTHSVSSTLQPSQQSIASSSSSSSSSSILTREALSSNSRQLQEDSSGMDVDVEVDESSESGEEEILEEGIDDTVGRDNVNVVTTIIPKLPPLVVNEIVDRYAYIPSKIKSYLMEILTPRLEVVGGGGGGTGSLVMTLTSFAALAQVRQMASLHLERWLGNPAIVETTRRLVQRIVECMVPKDDRNEKNSNSDDSNKKGGTLIQSDMQVIQEIVKLRPKMKASQAELYKSVLAAAMKKGTIVSELIFYLLLTEDLISSGKPENIKLITSLYLSLKPTPVVSTNPSTLSRTESSQTSTSKSSSSSLSSSSLTSPITATNNNINSSRILGNAIGNVCIKLALNSSSTSSSSSSSASSSSTSTGWTQSNSRFFLDLLIKIFKSIGSKNIYTPVLFKGILNSPSISARLFDVTDTDLFNFFSEIGIVLQLLQANEIVMSTREENASVSSVSSNSSSSTAATAGITSTSSSGAGGGRGGIEGGRGGNIPGRGGRGGRGGSHIDDILKSSMFRSHGLAKNPQLSQQKSMINASKPLPLSSSSSITSSSSSSITTAAPSDSTTDSTTPQQRLSISHALVKSLMLELLALNEVACEWVNDISAQMNTSSSSRKAGSHHHHHHHHQQHQQDKQIQANNSIVLDWIQKVLCVNFVSISKIQMDLDKQTAFYLRDNALINKNVLQNLVELALRSASNTALMHTWISFIESLLQRSLKTQIASDSDYNKKTNGIMYVQITG